MVSKTTQVPLNPGPALGFHHLPPCLAPMSINYEIVRFIFYCLFIAWQLRHSSNDPLHHQNHCMQCCAGKCRGDSPRRLRPTTHFLSAQHFTCIVGLKPQRKPHREVGQVVLDPLHRYLKGGTKVIFTRQNCRTRDPSQVSYSICVCEYECTLLMCLFCLFPNIFFLAIKRIYYINIITTIYI